MQTCTETVRSLLSSSLQIRTECTQQRVCASIDRVSSLLDSIYQSLPNDNDHGITLPRITGEVFCDAVVDLCKSLKQESYQKLYLVSSLLLTIHDYRMQYRYGHYFFDDESLLPQELNIEIWEFVLSSYKEDHQRKMQAAFEVIKYTEEELESCYYHKYKEAHIADIRFSMTEYDDDDSAELTNIQNMLSHYPPSFSAICRAITFFAHEENNRTHLKLDTTATGLFDVYGYPMIFSKNRVTTIYGAYHIIGNWGYDPNNGFVIDIRGRGLITVRVS